MNPQEAVHHTVSHYLAGLHSCSGLGQIPRSRQQVSDIARKQKNISGECRNNDPWFLLLNDSKFQARDKHSVFIRHVQVGAEPFCVLATKRQFNDIKRFCCCLKEYKPITVDPTFNFGPYNITPISYQHLL